MNLCFPALLRGLEYLFSPPLFLLIPLRSFDGPPLLPDHLVFPTRDDQPPLPGGSPLFAILFLH